MGVFNKRVAFKPFEYPDVTKFKEAINHSYWLVSEWNFIGDVHDFNKAMSPAERNVVKNTLLAISQIEVSVKRFWTKLGERFPKAEFEQVGVTFGESEVRHADAYSHLLLVLGLNDDFGRLLEVPAIKGRVAYLTNFLASTATSDNKDFTLCLTLFSMFIENVSLFAQFAIIKSFNKHKCVLKDIDNVIQATQKEETIHALFGAHLVNLIRQENPSWFDAELAQRLTDAANKAFDAECAVIDWIFEMGAVDCIQPRALKAFVKHRINQSMQMIGMKPCFREDTLDIACRESLRWFDEETHADLHVDFFHKRSVGYSKKTKSIQAGDLF